jgi:hypothetical protein
VGERKEREVKKTKAAWNKQIKRDGWVHPRGCAGETKERKKNNNSKFFKK